MLMKWYLLDFFPWHCYKVFTILPQIFYLIKFQCNIISLKTKIITSVGITVFKGHLLYVLNCF